MSDNVFRFCGVDDLAGVQKAGAAICRWPQKKITWTFTGSLSEFTTDQLKSAMTEAWRYWAEVCDIQPEYVTDVSNANVVMTFGRIDGSSNTLAWSELPCGVNENAQLTQKYDTGERWVIAVNPTNGIDIVRVAAHEIGHVIGISHIGSGNLLAPTYNSKVRKPQNGDIKEAQLRYGAPKPVEPTPEPTPSPALPPIDWLALLKSILDALLRSFGKK